MAFVLRAGDQLPITLLSDVEGRAGITTPVHTGPTAAKVGVTLGVIVIVRTAVVAHCAAFGVNV